ncbi:MAG: dihydroorotase family protein [Candidatus Nezhaarchaeota archaeon]|nr:dihydroorotase family protein [Candidatus Nezhaarchaeota archaeon]
MRLLIRNCKLYVGDRILENCYLIIETPLIADFGIDHGSHFSYDVNLNAQGRIILPGMIDAHVHLRDQLLTYKEDFKTGTASAVLGGVTSVIDMPNNDPPTDTPNNLVERMELAKSKILTNVGFTCKPSVDHNVNLELSKAGAIAFKVFLYEYIVNDVLDTSSVVRILSSISKLDRVLMLHCNIKSKFSEVLELTRKKNMFKLCRIEKELTEKVLRVAQAYKARLHFCHVSCPKVVEAINKHKGFMEVSLEVTIHHLFLNYGALEVLGPIAYVDPPLKSKSTAKSLFELLKRGAVDIVVTDHAPHAIFEKGGDDPKPGFPNLQLMMPILMTQVKKGRLPLSLVMEKTAIKPAVIFRIKRRGMIRRGYYADLVEVDFKRKLKVTSQILVSRAKYTPFEGAILTGIPVRTYVNGVCVNDDYTITGKGGEGKIILPGDELHEY